MPGKGNPRVNCRVTYAQFVVIRETAKKEGISISDFIRKCIQLYLLEVYKK